MSGAANPVMNIDPSNEDQDKLAEFESRIADGVLIEPGDWMPQAYRVGMILVHMRDDFVFGLRQIFEAEHIEKQVSGIDPVDDAETSDDMGAFHRHFV